MKSSGLIEPCPAMSVFFTIFEVIFKNLCNGMSLPTLQQFTDLISKENEAMSLFYNFMYHMEPITDDILLRKQKHVLR